MKQFRRYGRPLVAFFAALAIVVSVATACYAESDTVETELETVVVHNGESLTIRKDDLLSKSIRVRQGGRLLIEENGKTMEKVGPESDLGTDHSPLIASRLGTVVLRENKVIFTKGLYRITRSADLTEEIWKVRHEVFLIYDKNVNCNVTLKGPNTKTTEHRYDFARLEMSKGSSNETIGVEGKATYWWVRDLATGKGSWEFYNYTALFNVKELPVMLAKHPNFLLTARSWSECMGRNNGTSTVPAWKDSEGTVYKDLVYDKSRDDLNKYDIYVPNSVKQGEPAGVILTIHGGAWSSGEKADNDYLCRMYARAGYITATMDYRLFPDNKQYLLTGTLPETDLKMEDIVDDVENCVKALNKKLKKEGYQPKSLAVMGYSAGGHLATLYGYSRTDTSAIPVKLVLDMCGPIDMHTESFGNGDWMETLPAGGAGYLAQYTGLSIEQQTSPDVTANKRLESISPVHYVNEKTAPTVCLYGDYDVLVGGKIQSALLTAALKKNGVDYTSICAPKSDHSLELDQDAVHRFHMVSLQYLSKYM